MTRPRSATENALVMIANPSSDVYGSDLQMVQSVKALVAAGYTVAVTTPDDGPLLPKLEEAGAIVHRVDYPVLRRSLANARGVLWLAAQGATSVVRLSRFLRRHRPDVLYVNTVTLPWWTLAGRIAGVPVLCHVHEAERTDGRLVRAALILPLLAAHKVVTISRVAVQALTDASPAVSGRITMIYNGVPGPENEPVTLSHSTRPFRLVLIARLSPRKGIDVALEAVGLVRQRGYDCVLELCGTTFSGYEWFEAELRGRAAQPDLSGAVTFSGYVDPVWSTLAKAHAALAPSLREPFGNAVVEAQLAARPVVASAAMGHLETVQDGVTGLLVEAGEPAPLAEAIIRLIEDPELAASLARRGRQEAVRKFSVARYDAEIIAAVQELVAR